MAENVVKVCNKENVDISSSNEKGTCFFCNCEFSRYTCPRCNVSYCSTTCYKSEKHLKCSEDFYRDSVVQELTSRATDPKDVQNVLRMLKTLEEQDGEHDETDEISIEERFAGINLNTADVEVIWNTLTRDEQKEFEESLRVGGMSGLIDQWLPWWQQDDQSSNEPGIEVINPAATQDQTSSEHLSNKQKQSYPKVLKKIPAITGAANPLIKYSIIDVLYSYAYVMRLYNGEPEENLHQSVYGLYQLASSLSKNLSFDSIELVVHNALNTVQENKQLWNSQEFSQNTLLDVCKILSCKHVIDGQQIDFIDHALSDICRLFNQAKKAIKYDKESNLDDEKKMFLAKKKVEFFLSWVQDNKNVLSLLVPELKVVHYDLVYNSQRHDNERKRMDSSIRKKANRRKLIQEL